MNNPHNVKMMARRTTPPKITITAVEYSCAVSLMMEEGLVVVPKSPGISVGEAEVRLLEDDARSVSFEASKESRTDDSVMAPLR